MAADDLLLEFHNPPASARPIVWWRWMNGNVSEVGRSDLEWMKRIGIGGVQLFQIDLGTPLMADHKVADMPPDRPS